MIVGGKGVYFLDDGGKRYLDMSSQLMCNNLGYGNSRIVEAIKRQAEKLAYIAPSFDTEVREEVTRQLRGILPPNLTKYFYGSAGTEAVEAAIKIARLVKFREKKTKILSFYNSYHGSTMGSLQLTGDFRRPMSEYAEPAPGFAHLPPPNCYRCPFGLRYPDCGVACAEYVEYAIRNEGNVAAVIIEPVTGTNGVIIPPREFMPRLREITRDYGVFLIDDEVMTGFGRTGKWFACEHSGIQPDIITAAKGLTAAYTPLSLTAVNAEIADFFEDNYFPHGHTYEAHPLAMSAAAAALEEYVHLGIPSRVEKMGTVLQKELSEIAEEHPAVGDVRSIGLFGAVEIVKDRIRKTPFNLPSDKAEGKKLTVDMVAEDAMERGAYFNAWISHFVIAPPLIISEEELREGMGILSESLKIADKSIEAGSHA